MISGVRVSGMKSEMIAVERNEKKMTDPRSTASIPMLRRASRISPTAVMIAKAEIGPRMGERIMAPMTTAVLLRKRPVRATRPPILVIATRP